MTVRPAFRAEIVDGKAVQSECGVCVVCLRCDTPYVIVGHEPGGVIARRRVAAGVPIPEPVRTQPVESRRRGDANAEIDALSKSLGSARIMEEPA